MSWQTVLGFEIHVELATNSKMFCGCPADHFGRPPNTQTCPVCLGLPGALPVPNARAIEWCIKLGLALNCQPNLVSKFDRKNYFYPDLPKGYQVSQYDQPFCHSGWLQLPNGKKVRITRVHLEEDTGKLQHSVVDGQKVSLIDFNRSGVPLVEIVTEPDFDNSQDGTEFLKEVQLIVRALGISTADMEKGSMRLEANVSLRPLGETSLPPYKVEIKNVNSFRFIKKAIEYEVARQLSILESGTTPVQETRGFKESTGETVAQRTKEEAHDYRYFPEPDIPPFRFAPDNIDLWRSQLPPLPAQSRNHLISLGLAPHLAATIVASPARLQKFHQLAVSFDPHLVAKAVANCSEDRLSSLSLTPVSTISDQSQVHSAAAKVVAANPKTVSDYKSGKSQALFSLIGQVKKDLGPDVDVPLVKSALEQLISS